MSKKFDVVIGNPPYQEEAQGEGTRDTPGLPPVHGRGLRGRHQGVLITPARFLFNAGFTPKAWNKKMLADPHLTVPIYVSRQSERLFPSTTDFKRRDRRDVPRRGAQARPDRHIHQTPRTQLDPAQGARVEAVDVSSRLGCRADASYRYTQAMHEDHPEARAMMSEGRASRVSTNTFDQLAFLFYADRPSRRDEYVQDLGGDQEQAGLSLDSSRLHHRPCELRQYKVALPAANGSGQQPTSSASREQPDCA